jgi:hypothetical protein
MGGNAGLYIIGLGLGYLVLSIAKKEDKKVLKILGYAIGAIMILSSLALTAKEACNAKKMRHMMMKKHKMIMQQKSPAKPEMMLPPGEDLDMMMP